MAQTVVTKDSALWHIGRLVTLGIIVGIAVWLVGLFIMAVIIDPLSCGITGNTSGCTQSLSTAGGISLILITVAAIFVAIRLGVARPLVVAISAGVMMWGLSRWVDGLFWLEALGWSALIGLLAYTFFGWLNRYQSIAVTLIVTVIVLAFERIALSL